MNNSENWRVKMILRRAGDGTLTIDQARVYALEFGLLQKITQQDKEDLMMALEGMIPTE